MMSQHPLTDTTTPDTALMTKHAGWDAARAGNRAWIIDSGNPIENWFEYDHGNIKHLHRVRKNCCKALREGKTL